jgi:tetratricopeptide (TPR) repeat protein
MQYKFLKLFVKLAVPAVLLIAALIAVVSAQSTGTQSPTQSPAPAQRPQRPADEEALAKAAQIKDPGERTEALIKFVADFPRAPYIRNATFYLMRQMRPLYPEPEKVRGFINRFVEGTASASPYARTEFYYNISRELLNYNLLSEVAEDLSRRGVALLSEGGYIENERVGHEQREKYFKDRDAKYKVEEFSEAQAKEKFRTFRALNYATLGRALVKRDKLDEAEKTLKQAMEIAPSMEGGTALADIMEKRGRDAEALDYLSAAMLTGRMNAEGVARLHNLYQKLNNGKIDGLEASLDARYRKSFRAPIKVEHYRSSGNQTKPRSVLAEFITGAGCEPCISVDLSFDAVLERFSRKDVVLLVYHMHAPTSDPLSNHSAQARTAYYDAHGAPTTYIDGENLKPGEGLRTEAEGVFRNLDQALVARLGVAAEAQIKLDARFDGRNVRVSTSIDGLTQPSADLRLQIALVEQQVSYSGENGLRFHPMVVRNLARAAGSETYGFPVNTDGKGTPYVFSVDEIAAANLKYYDEYIADMKKRLGPQFEVSFKEQRYLMDPTRLAVVAFVQDDKTKKILQSAYVNIAADGKAAR